MIVTFLPTGDVLGTYFRIRGKERMAGMGKQSFGMKEDERERISEMDIDGLTEHNRQTPQ